MFGFRSKPCGDQAYMKETQGKWQAASIHFAAY